MWKQFSKHVNRRMDLYFDRQVVPGKHKYTRITKHKDISALGNSTLYCNTQGSRHQLELNHNEHFGHHTYDYRC